VICPGDKEELVKLGLSFSTEGGACETSTVLVLEVAELGLTEQMTRWCSAYVVGT
jgi:hypothetical protein